MRVSTKSAVLIFCSLLLAACSNQIDKKVVEGESLKVIRENIRSKYQSSSVKLENLSLIDEKDNKFLGSAKINVNGDKIDIPFYVSASEVESNIKVIVQFIYKDIDDQITRQENNKILKEKQKIEQKKIYIANLISKLNYIENNKNFLQFFPSYIRNNSIVLADYTAVGGYPEKVSGGYFSSGCAIHFCTIMEGAWYLSDDGSTANVAIMPDGYGKRFDLYGASYSDLPQPLLDWGSARGMDSSNSFRIE